MVDRKIVYIKRLKKLKDILESRKKYLEVCLQVNEDIPLLKQTSKDVEKWGKINEKLAFIRTRLNAIEEKLFLFKIENQRGF